MMKKLTKRCLTLLLAVLCVLGSCVTVFAAETDAFVPDTGDEEADALLSTFYNLMADAADNGTHQRLFGLVAGDADEGVLSLELDAYEELTGRSGQEFLDMTLLERFMWWSTYLRVGDMIHHMNPKTYNDWYAVIRTPRSMIQSHGTDEMYEAYIALMDWDYDYYVKYGEVFNFMEGKVPAETTALPVTTALETSAESRPTTAPTTSADGQEDDDVTEQETDGEAGDSTVLIQAPLLFGIIALLMLIVVIVVVLVVLLLRKQKASRDQ